MSTGLPSTSPKMAGCSSEAIYFYTADGLRFCFNYGKSESTEQFGEFTYGEMWVDINGDKIPNKTSKNAKLQGDTFPIVIMKNRFIPGHPTNSEVSRIAQDFYFGKKD